MNDFGGKRDANPRKGIANAQRDKKPSYSNNVRNKGRSCDDVDLDKNKRDTSRRLERDLREEEEGEEEEGEEEDKHEEKQR